MKTPVLKVARKGFDVRYANPKDLTIDSTKNQFKVFMEGGGTFVIPASESPIFFIIHPVFHGLEYQPQVIVEYEDPATGAWTPTPYRIESPNKDSFAYCTESRGPGEYMIIVYNYVDIFDPGHEEYSVRYKYKIFTEPIKDVWT